MTEIESLKKLLNNGDFAPNTQVEWNHLHCFWADYRGHFQTTVFAKYLLCPFSIADWRTLQECYDQFVADVIEPVYYDLQNDICWNLYFVVILKNSDFENIDYHTRYSFESNTEYTRNLIIKESQIQEYLPIGHVLDRYSSNLPAYPIDDWTKVLSDEKFRLEKSFEEDYGKLLSIFRFSHFPAQSLNQSLPHGPVLSIRDIHIPREFRSHIYDKNLDMEFKKVNLLVGANGTGKTSILSAIELAMTGHIRKQKEDASDMADYTDVSICLAFTDNQEEKLLRPVTPEEKKQRTLLWYDYAGNSTWKKLNSLYHCFNYFSVDDTFRFVNSPSEMINILSKTILGAETLVVWDEIEKLRGLYAQKKKEKQQELKVLQERLAQQPDVNAIYESDLWNYIERANLNFGQHCPLNQILSTVTKIEVELAAVSEYSPFDSLQETTHELEWTQNLLEKAQKHLEQLNVGMEDCKTQRDSLHASFLDTSERYRDTVRKIERLGPLEKMTHALSYATMHPTQIEMIQLLRLKLEASEKSRTKLYSFYNEYKDLLSYSEPPDPTELNGESVRLCVEKGQLTKEKSDLLQQISEVNQDIERRTQLLDQICQSGRELANRVPSLQECPLCGTKDIKPTQILRHLQERHVFPSRLQELEMRLSSVEKRLKWIPRREKAIEKLLLTAQKISIAYQTAVETAEFSDYITDAVGMSEDKRRLLSIHTILKASQRELKSARKIQGNISRLTGELMDRDGEPLEKIDLEEILTAEERLKDFLKQSGYEVPISCQGSELLDRVLSIQECLSRTAADQKSIVNDLRYQLDQIPFAEIGEQRREAVSDTAQLKQRYKELRSVQQFWIRISKLIRFDETMSGVTLKMHCTQIKSEIEKLINYRDTQREKTNLEDMIQKTEQMCDTYSLLLDRLDSLKDPAEYSRDYIKENIRQISHIFLNLHSPQEFSGLEMGDNGELLGLRNDAKVPINNMSAGQRTALVLSVFFQMHLSNVKAPHILLIDEPIVNIDDLNVLSLMDFLREMTVNHNRQIFITTANRNIAQLLRRKFSFLGSDFKKYNFSRENNSHMKITYQTYDQNRLVSASSLYE